MHGVAPALVPDLIIPEVQGTEAAGEDQAMRERDLPALAPPPRPSTPSPCQSGSCVGLKWGLNLLFAGKGGRRSGKGKGKRRMKGEGRKRKHREKVREQEGSSEGRGEGERSNRRKNAQRSEGWREREKNRGRREKWG